MTAYHMTCSCGHDIQVDAKTRDEAVAKFQSMMDKNAIDAHLKEKQGVSRFQASPKCIR